MVYRSSHSIKSNFPNFVFPKGDYLNSQFVRAITRNEGVFQEVHEDHPYSLPVYELMLCIFPLVLLFPLQTSNQYSSLLESTNKGNTHFPFDGWIYFSLSKSMLKGKLVIFPGWKAHMGERPILPLTLVLIGISRRDN